MWRHQLSRRRGPGDDTLPPGFLHQHRLLYEFGINLGEGEGHLELMLRRRMTRPNLIWWRLSVSIIVLYVYAGPGGEKGEGVHIGAWKRFRKACSLRVSCRLLLDSILYLRWMDPPRLPAAWQIYQNFVQQTPHDFERLLGEISGRIWNQEVVWSPHQPRCLTVRPSSA